VTDLNRPAEGDSEMAAPTDDGAEASLADVDDEEPVRSRNRSRPSNAVLLLGGLLVVVIAQLVMTWFVLTATTQVRDQSTLANGLQKCIIHAQLSENSTTDPSGNAYRAAVQTCVSK
jgi:hypothetical protein